MGELKAKIKQKVDLICYQWGIENVTIIFEEFEIKESHIVAQTCCELGRSYRGFDIRGQWWWPFRVKHKVANMRLRFNTFYMLDENLDDYMNIVVPHEMGHVTHQHSMTHLIRTIGFQTLIVPLISGGAMAADVLSEVGQAALQASYTREMEEDADRVAVALMNSAGLKAATFTDLLFRIEQKYGAPSDEEETEAGEEADDGSFSIPNIMASHPSTPDRARMVRELAAPGGEAGLDEAQWEALRSICGSGNNRN